jgi:diguanylate cyclase (GGDEF)-like protein/PAS domain S-box-containing protein
LTGYAPESLLHNQDLSYNDLITPEYRELLWHEWIRVLDRRAKFRQEYEILAKTGERKWVLELGQGVFDETGNVEALEGVVIDITELKTRQAEVTYLRERDFLTGLYNRNYYEMAKSRLDHPEFWPLSIAIFDINGVRMINDAYGHAEGDRLLANVARLIKGCCRPEDILARTGGDEFTLLMPQMANAEASQMVFQINSVVESFNRSKTPNRYDISLCMGYSTKESDEQKIDEIEKTAVSYLNHRKLLNQKSSHNATLSSIMATLYAKSQETEEHGHRLTQLTDMIGKALGSSQKMLDDLELLSMLHDIGKIGVDDRVLNKPGRLSQDEWVQMKKHSEIGHRIAMSTPELAHIADFILHHHENWDGTGYPAGLKGADIPLPSRILAVADAFDAMTENRVYRHAMPWEFAVDEIQRCSGSQFDPDIVRLFVGLIREQKDSCSKH